MNWTDLDSKDRKTYMHVQLVGISPEGAIVQRDDQPPVTMSWSLLHEAQQQIGIVGGVYQWLMREYCRASYAQKNGLPWSSPRRSVADIAAELQLLVARDKQKEKEEAERSVREAKEEAIQAETQRVSAERKDTASTDPWWPIPGWEIPDGVRFDTPGRNQGQIVEVAYGDFGRGEASDDSPYMRILDRSGPDRRYYRRREVRGS